MANKAEHFARNNSLHKYHLQPLKDIHLRSDFDDDLQAGSRADYLYLFFVSGFLILIAVGFNYLNFSFTNLLDKSSCIGIKKVNGAGNFSLITQGIAESVIIHLFSLILAFVISLWLVQPVYNNLGITIDLSTNNHLFWFVITGIILISVFINGTIPVYLIGRVKSVELLMQKKLDFGGIPFRHLLLTGQFVIAIAIIVAIIGMNRQIGFLEGREKGFEISNDLVIEVPQNILRSSQRLNNLEAF